MRCSHPERACTFVFTTLLFILSFITALAESATVHGFHARHAWRKRASIDMIPTGQVITSAPGGLLPTTIPPLPTIPTSLPSVSIPILSPPTPLPPLSIPNLQTSNPTAASSSSDSSTPSTSVPSTSTSTSTSTTSTTTSQAQVQTTSNGTPLSISSSASSASSASSYLSSSQHSSSTTPSTSAAATAGAATPIAQISVTAGYSGPVISTSYATGTITSSTPSSTSSSNSGFFSNTGAVAGTFTIAGLVGVAGIIGVGMMIARRRVSRRYEDDMEYLEKNREPQVELSQSQNYVVGDVEELSDLSHVSQSMEVTVPPAAHLYPQHDVYLAHGHTANESDGFENQGYYPQVAYAPQEYGIAYPPRESFAAEDAYGGLDEARSEMPNPFDNVATESSAASQHSNQYLRTASPPLTAYLHRSVDSFYGSSAAASHGHAM